MDRYDYYSSEGWTKITLKLQKWDFHQATLWGQQKFGIDIAWVEPDIWFKEEKDAVIFALKWS